MNKLSFSHPLAFVFVAYALDAFFIATLFFVSDFSFVEAIEGLFIGALIPLATALTLHKLARLMNDPAVDTLSNFVQFGMILIITLIHVKGLTKFGFRTYSSAIYFAVPSLLVAWLIYSALLLLVTS
jgi:hypothetical protein